MALSENYHQQPFGRAAVLPSILYFNILSHKHTKRLVSLIKDLHDILLFDLNVTNYVILNQEGYKALMAGNIVAASHSHQKIKLNLNH